MSQIPKALMEVEVKLWLLEAAAHRQVTTLLAPVLVATHRQENLFFDGSKAELATCRAVLRLRFSDRSPLCAVTLRAQAVLVQGVSRVEKDKEDLNAGNASTLTSPRKTCKEHEYFPLTGSTLIPTLKLGLVSLFSIRKALDPTLFSNGTGNLNWYPRGASVFE